MLDATGRTIEELGARREGLPETERPGQVMVIVVDDTTIVEWFTEQASAPRHTCIVWELTAEEQEAVLARAQAEARTEEAKAQTGHGLSQLGIGVKYLRGEGVAADPTKAFEWLSKAADQRYPDAQFLVGTMYAVGIGAPRDDVKAFMVLNLAAAPRRFDLAVEGKELLRQRMTFKQVAEAQRLSTAWFEGFESTEFFARLTSWFDID